MVYDFESERKQIIKDLLEEIKEKALTKKIKYDEFLVLYEPYKNEIMEIEFAYLLGISENRFDSFKRQKNTYATILGRITDYENIVLDEIEDGTYLDYAAFLDLYKDVITEIKFAERLGIESNNYWRMKKGVFRTRANLNLKLKIRVKYLFSQSKFYEMDDFNDVCNKYGCSSRCCN